MTRTPAEVRQLVQAYVRAFNARDLDAVMSIYGEDATLEDPVGTPLARGKAAIRAFYAQFDEQRSFLQLTGDFRYAGDAVAFSFFCYMEPAADPMIVHVTDSFRFDEHGLVAEMRAFWGEANVHRLPSPPAAGSQLPLAGRVALVNGDDALAASCAHALARNGAVVGVAGDPSATKAIAAAISDEGGRAFCLPIDPLDEQALEALPDAVKAAAGRLDCCVNLLQHAGVHSAHLTALCAAEQLLAFHDLKMRGAIINVIDAHWREAMPEAVRAGASHTARINCLVPDDRTDPSSLAAAVVWLASPAAAAIDGQVISLSNPV